MSGGKTSSPKSQPKTTTATKTTSTKTPSTPTKNESDRTASKHHEGGRGKHHGDSHGGLDVGIGVNVDLGGIGHRSAEPDPFAVGGPQPVAHTQERPEKPRTKETPREITTPNPFSNVALTGPQAKEESEPPGPISVSNDEETPPALPPNDTFAPKTNAPSDPMDDLKKAKDAYKTAEKKFFDNDPDYQAALKQYSANVGHAGPGTTAEKKAQKAFKKMVARKDHFKANDGKKLFDDWMKAYASVNKPGTDMPDDLVPPDKMEQAKHDVAQAQNALNNERETYDAWKNAAVADSDGVKNIQAEIDALKKKVHHSDKDLQTDKEKLKKLEADLENAKKAVAKEWAESNGAKNQMKKVQQAEKKLDEAKESYKPFEKFDEKPKAASNP